MKIFMTLGWLGIAALGAVNAQIVIPASPKNFKTRPIEGGTGGGQVEVIPRDSAVPKKRTITYMVLSESRPWTSTEGKVLEAKLIAFEDIILEGEDPAAAEPPPHPTVVRNGKVRLLAGKKSYELDLSRLTEPDRSFIEQIRIRHQKKTPPAP
jgi:hypothetical protein